MTPGASGPSGTSGGGGIGSPSESTFADETMVVEEAGELGAVAPSLPGSPPAHAAATSMRATRVDASRMDHTTKVEQGPFLAQTQVRAGRESARMCHGLDLASVPCATGAGTCDQPSTL